MAARTQYLRRYGDIADKLEKSVNALHQTSVKSAAYAVRAMSKLLRHPRYPFDLRRAKSVKIKEKDFALRCELLSCDCCGKNLWNEEIYRIENANPDEALCGKCALCDVGTDKWDGSGVTAVEIVATSLDAKGVGFCRMHGSNIVCIASVLSKLGRQRTNGMRTGLVLLRYKNPVLTGNQFKMINFLVGPGPDREVFFVDPSWFCKRDNR